MDWKADGDSEWHTASDDTSEQLRGLFEETVATSDRILHDALASADGLGAVSKLTSRHEPGQRFSLRWVLVHLIEEYARHNGHADLLRESIDGQVGE